MIIERLIVEGHKGFPCFHLKFVPGPNLLIGINGCGKTTVLDLIAGLTGTDAATRLLLGETVKYVRIDVCWNASEHVVRKETLEMTDGFHATEIAAFKAKLPVRSSYVLRHELYDGRYVGELDDRAFRIKDTLSWLKNYDMRIGGEHMTIHPNGDMSMWVSDTGAQRYLMVVGMRIPPKGVPTLVDMPERSLHMIIRRSIAQFYGGEADRQVFMATHCPEVLSGLDRYNRQGLDDWHNKTYKERPQFYGVIDMSDTKYHSRKDYK